MKIPSVFGLFMLVLATVPREEREGMSITKWFHGAFHLFTKCRHEVPGSREPMGWYDEGHDLDGKPISKKAAATWYIVLWECCHCHQREKGTLYTGASSW